MYDSLKIKLKSYGVMYVTISSEKDKFHFNLLNTRTCNYFKQMPVVSNERENINYTICRYDLLCTCSYIILDSFVSVKLLFYEFSFDKM